MSKDTIKMRFWATVSIDGGYIRDVEQALDLKMATRLLTSNYSPELKAMYEVKPVSVTVDDDGRVMQPTS